MTGSGTSIQMYNTTTGQFSMYGRNYIRSYYAHTPHRSGNECNEIAKHTGCPKRKLQLKFSRMRKYYKRKAKHSTNSCQQLSSPQRSLSLSSPVQTDELSIPIQFLNSISTAQAIAFSDKMLSTNLYKYHINPIHVDEEIKPEEIITLTSAKYKDGNFFHDWMCCHITSAHIERPPTNYPSSTFKPSSVIYKCLQPNIKVVAVFKHHIVLRAKLQSLPALSSAASECASHLCNTQRCVRAEHLVIERFSTNNSRSCCPSVILTLKSQGVSRPKKIIQIEPCFHGMNNPESNGDPLKFTCRRIQVLIQPNISKPTLIVLKNLCLNK